MNREIKFRAWDKEKKLMITPEMIRRNMEEPELEGFLYEDNEFWPWKPIYYLDGIYELQQNHKNLEIMQYTGLKDKTGKEIYEGDIVHWKECEPIDDEIVYEGTFVVYWSDEFLMWKAKNEDTDYIDLYVFTDTREIEVIGNIYQNKELLNEHR